jgi:hypothetical protein
MDLGINRSTSAPEDVLRAAGIEVGPRAEGLGHLSPSDIVDLWLPVIFEADDNVHILGFTGPEALNTGIPKLGEQAVALPGLIDREMPAVMRAGGTEVVAPRRPAAHGEDCMHLERRIRPSAGTLLTQGVTHPDRRGIDDVPILHATEWSRHIDWLRSGISDGTLRQSRHEAFEGLSEPPLEGRPCDRWHLTLQVGPQDVGLIGPARRSRRDDYGPDQHPQVQLAWPLDHATRHAEAVDLISGQHGFEHAAYILSCHAPSLRYLLSFYGLLLNPPGGVKHVVFLQSRSEAGARSPIA